MSQLGDKKAAIISYITNLPKGSSKRVLSGQNWYASQGTGSDHLSQVNSIVSSTGKVPAILGVGWDWFGIGTADAVRVAKDWAANGGIVFGGSWPYNPSTAGPPSDVNIKFSDLLTIGTTARTNWLTSLDVIASQLQLMQSANHVTFFRPFIEVNGNWFWWGNQNPSDFIDLWHQTYDYLTVNKGLQDSIIWVYNVAAMNGNYTTYYPGSAYVDVVSLDYYGDSPGSASQSTYASLLTLRKPIMFAEFGCCTSNWNAIKADAFTYDNSQLIRDIQTDLPEVFAFMVWDSNWAISQQNGAQTLLDDPWIVNRTDLPPGF